MSKLKAFIVDDEEDAISSLQILLKEFFPQQLEVVGFSQSLSEAVEKLQEFEIDLLFLDIDLGEGTGFDLLQKIGSQQFEVIFVTAYEQYALEAIRANALAYLLKPVNIGEFKDVVSGALSKISQLDFSDLAPLLRQFKPKSQKIGVPVSHGTEYINKQDILYVQAEGSYSRIHRKGDKPLVISRNLKRFEELLDKEDFFRVHNSVLINVNEIARFDRLEGEKVIMTDGTNLPISRKYKSGLNEILQRWDRI